MPPSIIAKRVAADLSDGNSTRTRALIAYCSRPEDEDAHEKCVLFRTYGFSDDNNMDAESVADELDYTLSLTKYQDKELVSHWVLSWKDGTPTPAQALDAARMLASDLGYSSDHKITVAIHADTDNIHAHVCACRVHSWTGKLLNEGNGWWKDEAQRSLARIAHVHGWDLEAGARYRVRPNTRPELHTTPDGKEVIRPSVAKVKAQDKTMRARPLKASEENVERHTGAESEQRQLQRALERFFEKHPAEQTKTWKAADLHRELARIGVSCERVTHGKGRHGLVFSLGETRYKASDLLHGLSYRSLLERLGGGWRDAREEIAPILAEARARRAAPAPTPKEAERMTEYAKSIKDALRKVPVEKVFESLGLSPIAVNRDGKPIKTAYDVCFYAGKTYSEATEYLARTFPDYTTPQAPEPGKKPPEPKADELVDVGNMGVAARKIKTMMDALQVDKMDILTHVPPEVQVDPNRPRNVRLEAATYDQIARRLPLLAHLNALGIPGKAPVSVYCRPVWPEGKIGIMVDDARPELAQEYPPTLELQTSAEGRPQAFYVVPRKYPEPFYDYAAGVLNERYGDRAVKSTRHPTRLPGFQNQKRERASWVSVKSTRPGPCPEMEARLDKMYAAWRASGKEAELYRLPAKPDERQSVHLAVVDLPQKIERIGRAEQERLRQTYGPAIDRSRADWMVAKHLYEKGATPDQVYAFFRAHLMQAEGVSADGVPRIRSNAEHDRQARRLALRAQPTAYTGAGSDYWQTTTPPEPQTPPPVAPYEQEREAAREAIGDEATTNRQTDKHSQTAYTAGPRI